ncbi:hypothetical protein [Thalassobaculum sp.]|uniref:hypothetical protein n=1 Tax=Thalassobaculum sp. TaxID=2022740 RepID=UPI003B5CC017
MRAADPSIVGLDLQVVTSIDQIEGGRWYRADRVAPLFDLTKEEMIAAARMGDFGPIREHAGVTLIRGNALLDVEPASKVNGAMHHAPQRLLSAKEASERLGISQARFKSCVADQVPYRRIGSDRRWSIGALTAWALGRDATGSLEQLDQDFVVDQSVNLLA